MRQSEKFAGTPEYYEVARAIMWAEWKAGQELREAERDSPGPKGDTSQPGTQPGFYALIKGHKLAKTTAYRWITMSFASREEVERRASCRHRTESSRVS